VETRLESLKFNNNNNNNNAIYCRFAGWTAVRPVDDTLQETEEKHAISNK
jgi:hypothetical protein